MQNSELTDTAADQAPQVDSELLMAVSVALGALDEVRIRRLVEVLRPPDLADLIELLEAGERAPFVQALGSDIDYDVFSELDETVRDQLSKELPNSYLAKAVT